ncbi:hypothetical protein BSG1_14814 [Bacillus sp. SG-1]|nr:hypothetical protein BSG1_14814 [Bacillus sp. SG-1]
MFVDEEDIAALNETFTSLHLTESNSGLYVRGLKKDGTMVRLHRFLMNTPKGLQCHHKNGDRLDNRKDNLENVTVRKNLQFRQGRGVLKVRNVYQNSNGTFMVSVQGTYIGSYRTIEEADKTARDTRLELFGEKPSESVEAFNIKRMKQVIQGVL